MAVCELGRAAAVAGRHARPSWARASLPAQIGSSSSSSRPRPSNSSLTLSSSSNGKGRVGSTRTQVALKEAELRNSAWKEEEQKEQEKEEESPFQPTEAGPDPPNAFEVLNLIMELCDETDIAELKVKVGSFLLHVKRQSGTKHSARHEVSMFQAPPVPSAPMAQALAEAGPPTTATARAVPVETAEEVDEGLLYVNSSTVGILRRGRIVKGKRGKNLIEEGSEIKKGQVVCYVEQLGAQLAVESEHFGEVVRFLINDGDAVGFGDPIIAIRPDFPGIKKLA